MTDLALSSAVSSLLIIEKQMGVASNNIANASTVGYTRETVQTAARITGGVGTGVTDLGTVSNVDQYMQAAVITANGQATQAAAYDSIYQNLQAQLGQITTGDTGGNDIASQLSTIEASINQLANTPQDASLRTQVVGELDNFASNMRSISSQIQQLRTTADSQISGAVNDANTQLNTIAQLNKQIQQAQALGQPTASMMDQRATALQSLTGDLSVSYYTDGTGAMQIYTSGGQPLLIGNVVNQLSHNAATIGATSTYPGTIDGIMVGNTDITSQITSGKIAAYVQQRDTELPNAQNGLDVLAQNLSTTLNGIANKGTASPAPSSLTGSSDAKFAATDSVAPSAGLTVRVALVDSSGQVQSYQDVNLGAAATVNDVETAINAAFPGMATVTGSGQLSLTSTTPGQGIAVSTVSGNLGGTDFSSYFHLNDVLTNGSSAATLSVNSALLANANLLPTATLNTTPTTVPYVGIGSGDGSTATALDNALLGNQTFSASTATGIAPQSSATAPLGLSGSFTIEGGSSPVPVTITAGMSLTAIAAAITAAGTAAGVPGVTATVVGSGSYQLQVTTGGTSLSFGNVNGTALISLGLSSRPSGYLGTATTTFASYATSIISDVATRASSAKDADTAQQTTLTAMQSNLSAQSGVNVDEEMANLTTLQNAYAASAKIITTVNSMFQSLLQAVGA